MRRPLAVLVGATVLAVLAVLAACTPPTQVLDHVGHATSTATFDACHAPADELARFPGGIDPTPHPKAASGLPEQYPGRAECEYTPPGVNADPDGPTVDLGEYPASLQATKEGANLRSSVRENDAQMRSLQASAPTGSGMTFVNLPRSGLSAVVTSLPDQSTLTSVSVTCQVGDTYWGLGAAAPSADQAATLSATDALASDMGCTKIAA